MNKPGRPKQEEITKAVIEATKELLLEKGYPALSIEAIARKAEVGKPAIYRRWKYIGLLVFDALFSNYNDLLVSDTGSISGDLHSFLKLLSTRMNKVESREALAGLISDFQKNSELQTLLFEKWLHPVSTIFKEIISRSVARGEISEPKNSDLLLDSIAGTVFFRSLMLKITLKENNIQELINIILNGILTK